MRQKKLITKKKQIFKNITLIVVVVIKMLDEKKTIQTQFNENLCQENAAAKSPSNSTMR